MKKHVLQVLDGVMNASFDVVAKCCDNHPINRSFIITSNRDINFPLCESLKPTDTVFLLIDRVYTIKNV